MSYLDTFLCGRTVSKVNWRDVEAVMVDRDGHETCLEQTVESIEFVDGTSVVFSVGLDKSGECFVRGTTV